MELKKQFEHIPKFVTYLERYNITKYNELVDKDGNISLYENFEHHELIEIKRLIRLLSGLKSFSQQEKTKNILYLNRQLARYGSSESEMGMVKEAFIRSGLYDIDCIEMTYELYQSLVRKDGKVNKTMEDFLTKIGVSCPKKYHKEISQFKMRMQVFGTLPIDYLILYTSIKKVQIKRLKAIDIEVINDIFTKDLLDQEEKLFSDVSWCTQFLSHMNALKEMFPRVIGPYKYIGYYNEKVSTALLELGVSCWEDFQDLNTLVYLEQNMRKTHWKDVQKTYPRFQYAIDHLAAMFALVKENPNYTMVVEKYLYGVTLEASGQRRGLTKERVRQVLKKIVSKIEPSINALVIEWKKHVEINNGGIDVNQLLEHFQATERMILKNILCSYKTDQYCYFDTLDTIYLCSKVELEEQIEILIQQLINQDKLLTQNQFQLVITQIRDEYNLIFDESEIERFALGNKYYKYNSYYVSKDASKYEIMLPFLTLFYPDGLIMDEEPVKLFREFLYKEIGIDTRNDSLESLSSRFQDVDCFILYQAKTYGSIHNVKIKDELAWEIVEAIAHELTTYESILTEHIYLRFKTKLTLESNIDSYQKLYGYLKCTYQKYFTFHKFKIAKKIGDEVVRKTNAEQVIDWIKSRGCKATKQEFLSVFQFNQSSISPIFTGKNKFILTQKGNQIAYYENNPFSKSFILELNLRIESTMVHGYVNQDMLFECNRDFFILNDITTSYDAFSIAWYVLESRYDFFRPGIQIKDMNQVVTLQNLLLQALSVKPKRYEDLKYYFADTYRISEAMFCALMNKNAKDLIRISFDEFALETHVKMNADSLKRIADKISVALEKKSYLKLGDLINYIDKNDHIQLYEKEYGLNSYCVVSLIDQYCNDKFKVLYTTTRDYRYEIPLICSIDTTKTATDIIIDEIRFFCNHNDSMNANEVASYLKKIGLIQGAIPFEVLNNSNIVVDECNFIKVKYL